MSVPKLSGRLACLLLCLASGALFAQAPKQAPDPVLLAMSAEIGRSRELRLVSLDEPYYVEYGLEDAHSFAASATLGALIQATPGRFRVPHVEVRVGSYAVDNTNYVFTDFFGGPRYERGQVPLDDDLYALRHYFWLSTDRAFKGAVEAIARKAAALRSITVRNELPDFSKAEPVRMILEANRLAVDEALWTRRIRGLSALFTAFPKVIFSQVDFEAVSSSSYFMNSEGAVVRMPDRLAYLRVRASGQAPDGMRVRDAAVVQGHTLESFPSETEIQRITLEVARNVTALAEAVPAESYVGPVLLESEASPQLFAQLLGGNLAATRKPVGEPNRPVPFQPGEFEGRLGSPILPEWIDVVDDPTQRQWRGLPLFGHYLIDMEGVVPSPLRPVEKGVFKAFLTTRQPIAPQHVSSGRARLPGSFGAKAAVFGNLFISAAETVSPQELRERLLDLCRRRNKPYGLLIRKLDFPTSASLNELRHLAAIAGQRGGGSLVSPPLLVYRLYPDGREELVRGLQFSRLSARSLRDILAASDETHRFDFMGNRAPLSMMGAGGFVTTCTVVAPSVLFDELELERLEAELPVLPVVPPPPLDGGG